MLKGRGKGEQIPAGEVTALLWEHGMLPALFVHMYVEFPSSVQCCWRRCSQKKARHRNGFGLLRKHHLGIRISACLFVASELSSKNIVHGLIPKQTFLYLMFLKPRPVMSLLYTEQQKLLVFWLTLNMLWWQVTMGLQWRSACIKIKLRNEQLFAQSGLLYIYIYHNLYIYIYKMQHHVS